MIGTWSVAFTKPEVGVTVMPEWFQCEGIDAVLDRVQALGASAIVTSPYLLERVPQGEGAREPPPDGEAGKVSELLERKQALLAQLRQHLRLKALLEIWLYVHVPLTFVLIAALTAHVISVFFYW